MLRRKALLSSVCACTGLLHKTSTPTTHTKNKSPSTEMEKYIQKLTGNIELKIISTVKYVKMKYKHDLSLEWKTFLL